MKHSHLKKHLQQQIIRNILLSVGGIIILIFLLATVGTQLLINFSLFLDKFKSPSQTTIVKDNATYVEPPTLNAINSATNSAKTTINGYGVSKQKINLYVNGKLVDKTTVTSNKIFTFSNVTLAKGSNEIKAKAITEDNHESDYSTSMTITYIDKPPSLDILSPQDGQTFSKGDSPTTISGKTDAGDKVTINDFWAIVQDDGNFSYTLALHDGDNDIKIIATDEAGNKTTKEIKVKVN